MRQDKEEALVKQYLLGELQDGELDEVEERLVIDPVFREQVLVFENLLIEDYLAGDLSFAERKRFETHFLASPQQLHRFRVAQALERHFSRKGSNLGAAPSVSENQQDPGKPPSPLFFPFSKPAQWVALAALGLLILGLGWFVFKRWRAEQLGPEAVFNREFQQELVRLNTSLQVGTVPPVAATVTLPAVTVREGGNLPELKRPAETGNFQLLLALPPDSPPYRNYRVELYKVGDQNRFIVDNLGAGPEATTKTVSLIIPAKYLSRADYLVDLSGQNSAGQFEPIGGYNFRVAN